MIAASQHPDTAVACVGKRPCPPQIVERVQARRQAAPAGEPTRPAESLDGDLRGIPIATPARAQSFADWSEQHASWASLPEACTLRRWYDLGVRDSTDLAYLFTTEQQVRDDLDADTEHIAQRRVLAQERAVASWRVAQRESEFTIDARVAPWTELSRRGQRPRGRSRCAASAQPLRRAVH